MRGLVLAALLGLTACSDAPIETAAPAVAAATAPPSADLYVLRRGKHTDLVLPVAQIRGPLAALEQEFPGAGFLVIGFGDRQYMLAGHKNFLHVFLAPFPGAGIMLVSGIGPAPAQVYGADHLVALAVPPARLDAVEAFIWGSLKPDAQGVVKPYLPGKYAGNTYYASSKTYDGFYTCNTWTAEALQIGGLPVRSGGVLFAGQVWDQLASLKLAASP